jgi:hypothetical protein
VDTRTRWIVGVLVALVIGLGVGLIVVAADNSKDTTTTIPANGPATAKLTEPTTTSAPTTSTTAPNGGSGVPGGTTAPGGGSGGL